MPRVSPIFAVFALVAFLIGSGSWVARTSAQMATPGAEDTGAPLVLIEHADLVTEVDLGEAGPSIGDMLVWGPNALYNEADTTDTGATTQGACITFNAEADCIANESILFPDGSTLELQGIERGGGVPSMRTIVGGSGRYLGAAGTVDVTPSADLLLWTKTFTFAAPEGRR
ncbi:MAG: hypothetical protein H0V00_17385 [Chloroflexia bacterium]|nr:hypothetical protein [Chloroflexia bacterium]